MSIGPVTYGCNIFCFYGQYKFLDEHSFHSSCFVEDLKVFVVLVFQFFLGVAGSRYRDAEVSWMELTDKWSFGEEGISGQADH